MKKDVSNWTHFVLQISSLNQTLLNISYCHYPTETSLTFNLFLLEDTSINGKRFYRHRPSILCFLRNMAQNSNDQREVTFIPEWRDWASGPLPVSSSHSGPKPGPVPICETPLSAPILPEILTATRSLCPSRAHLWSILTLLDAQLKLALIFYYIKIPGKF